MLAPLPKAGPPAAQHGRLEHGGHRRAVVISRKRWSVWEVVPLWPWLRVERQNVWLWGLAVAWRGSTHFHVPLLWPCSGSAVKL